MTRIFRSVLPVFLFGLAIVSGGCDSSSSDSTVTFEDPDTGMVYQQGIHFQEVNTPIENANDLTVFFSFKCPHCKNFHPTLKNWLATQTQQPSVLWVPTNLSKAHASGIELDASDAIKSALFECVIEQWDSCLFVSSGSNSPTDEEVAQWLSEHANTDYTASLQVLQSDKVTQLAASYSKLVQQVQPKYVPQVVVSGRYEMELSAFQSWDDYFNLVELLISQNKEP